MEMFLKFLVAAVAASIPLLFGTVGEILCEKVGHLNLGVEGLMSIGACAGFMVGMQTDSFVLALIAAFVAGVIAALIYAVLTVSSSSRTAPLSIWALSSPFWLACSSKRLSWV